MGVSTASDFWTNVNIRQRDVCLDDVKQALPGLTTDVLAQHAEECLLFFWTNSALFSVVYEESNKPVTSFSEYSEQKRPILQDEVGTPVGFVCKTATAARETQLQEFVAVGRRQINGMPESLADEICPPVTLALQVNRDHLGICSRINYAEINQKAWTHAKPRPVLVALQ